MTMRLHPSKRSHLLECCRAVTGRDVPHGKLQWLEVYPRWLRWALVREAKAVRSFLASDRAELSPVEAKERLSVFRDAVQLVRGELMAPVIVAHLRHYGEAAGQTAELVDQVLQALSEQATDAIARIPGGRGVRIAPALEQDATISGQQLCAWAALQAVEHHTGSRPGVRNPRAIDTAISLLALAGGAEIGPDAWAAHFTEVRRLEKSNTYRSWGLRERRVTFRAEPAPVV